MNLVSLASHTIDVDLLPEEPIVLDVGCRWFDFTRGVLALRPKARIIGMDCSSDVVAADGPAEFSFMRYALVGDAREFANFAEGIAGDGGGNHVIEGDREGDYRIRRVECRTITDVMTNRMLPVKHFDAVKLDIEGSEFGVLENWPGPIATQISVEFHDWSGPWKEHTCDRALIHLQTIGYRVVQHELSKQGNGVGHWDSLFALAN